MPKECILEKATVTIPHAAITVVIIIRNAKCAANISYNTARGNHSCNSRILAGSLYGVYVTIPHAAITVVIRMRKKPQKLVLV